MSFENCLSCVQIKEHQCWEELTSFMHASCLTQKNFLKALLYKQLRSWWCLLSLKIYRCCWCTRGSHCVDCLFGNRCWACLASECCWRDSQHDSKGHEEISWWDVLVRDLTGGFGWVSTLLPSPCHTHRHLRVGGRGVHMRMIWKVFITPRRV